MNDKAQPYKDAIGGYLAGTLSAAEFRTWFIEARERSSEDSRINGDGVREELDRLRLVVKQDRLSSDEFAERRARLWGYESQGELEMLVDTENACRFTESALHRRSKPKTQAELDGELRVWVGQVWASYRMRREDAGPA